MYIIYIYILCVYYTYIIYIYKYIHIYIYIYTYICMYIFMCVYMCVYIYMYIYIIYTYLCIDTLHVNMYVQIRSAYATIITHTHTFIQDDLVFADHTLPRCVYWEGKLYPLPGTLQDAPFFQVCFCVSVYWDGDYRLCTCTCTCMCEFVCVYDFACVCVCLCVHVCVLSA